MLKAMANVNKLDDAKGSEALHSGPAGLEEREAGLLRRRRPVRRLQPHGSELEKLKQFNPSSRNAS
jgi:hypothetical protein